MKGKVGLVIGLSVGYVLGTRAGRERYEQIKTQWLKLWHTAPVQRQAVKADPFTKSAVAAVQGVLWAGAKRVGKAVAATQQTGPSKATGDDVRKAFAEAADELGDAVEDAASDAKRAADKVAKPNTSNGN